MAEKSEVEAQDFLQPWKLSDVVLVVEEERLHVHRAVLALWSPVFERMFTSEFQEKDNSEIPLPGKNSCEVKELLLMIYPSTAEKQITEENCYFLVKLAHEYQMDGLVQKCEDFMVDKLKSKPNGAIADLVFAQTYKLEKLRRASLNQAHNLNLEELKKDEKYDQIRADDLKEITEGIIRRLQGELKEAQGINQQNENKINDVKRISQSVLIDIKKIASGLVSHYNLEDIRFTDTNDYLTILALLERGDLKCDCSSRRVSWYGLREVAYNLQSLKSALEFLISLEPLSKGKSNKKTNKRIL